MNPVGEPCAGNPHARFDERGWETEPTWPPRPTSTLMKGPKGAFPGFVLGEKKAEGVVSGRYLLGGKKRY
jgi:hypothetical protein